MKGKYMVVNDHAFLMENIHSYEKRKIGKSSGNAEIEGGDNQNIAIVEWDCISEGEKHPYPYFGVFVSMALLLSIVITISICSG